MRVGRIGHESLSLLFALRDSKTLSALDPASLSQSDMFRLSILRERCAGTFLYPHTKNRPEGGDLFCAGRENRTPVYCLEGSHSTTKLYPHFPNIADVCLFRISAAALQDSKKSFLSQIVPSPYSFLYKDIEEKEKDHS